MYFKALFTAISKVCSAKIVCYHDENLYQVFTHPFSITAHNSFFYPAEQSERLLSVFSAIDRLHSITLSRISRITNENQLNNR